MSSMVKTWVIVPYDIFSHTDHKGMVPFIGIQYTVPIPFNPFQSRMIVTVGWHGMTIPNIIIHTMLWPWHRCSRRVFESERVQSLSSLANAGSELVRRATQFRCVRTHLDGWCDLEAAHSCSVFQADKPELARTGWAWESMAAHGNPFPYLLSCQIRWETRGVLRIPTCCGSGRNQACRAASLG